MSLFGSYSMRLSPDRLAELDRQEEEARRERVGRQVQAVLADVQKAASGYQHHLTQVFGQQAQREAEDLASQARQLLQSDPDKALTLARRSLLASRRGLTDASQRVAAWTQNRAQAEEAVGMLKLAVDGLLHGASVIDGAGSHVGQAAAELAKANAAMMREDFSAAKTAAARGQDQVLKAEQMQLQQEHAEAIRREIVRGLREVLMDMGFTVEKPCKDNDSVSLVGRLPSGRTATFSISLDGQVRYDFDGYSHRACGKDRQAIRKRLEARCNAQTSQEVEHWKDEEPLRLASGSRDLPTTNTRFLR